MAARARPPPVRCAHPSFWAHCHAKRGAARPPPSPPIAASLFLILPQKYIKSVELGPPTSMAFFFPQEHRGYEIGSPRLSFSFSFSSYSSLLILLFLSLLILLGGAILRLLIFLLLYFKLFVVLQTCILMIYIFEKAKPFLIRLGSKLMYATHTY